MRTNELAVIAEIKRRSPSRGELADIPDVTKQAKSYLAGGAAAISVLTDKHAFAGSLDDLKMVSETLKSSACAILRKDFIIDACQIAEAIAYGADALLLIVAALKTETEKLLNRTKELGIDALVEVHDREERVVFNSNRTSGISFKSAAEKTPIRLY
ncbi:hypothetical protein ACFL35_21420 [Candidatus Riflebacteria bacterium]